MPWPTDPAKREIIREKLRKAALARWARPGAREAVAVRSRKQFADPAQREKQAKAKHELYEREPEVKEQIANTLAGRKQPRELVEKRAESLRRHNERKKRERIELIRQRAEARRSVVGCADGTT